MNKYISLSKIFRPKHISACRCVFLKRLLKVYWIGNTCNITSCFTILAHSGCLQFWDVFFFGVVFLCVWDNFLASDWSKVRHFCRVRVLRHKTKRVSSNKKTSLWDYQSIKYCPTKIAQPKQPQIWIRMTSILIENND